MLSKLSINLKGSSGSLDMKISHRRIKEKEDLTHRKKDKLIMDPLKTTSPSRKQRRVMRR
jgi:hypothetical protein